jgi:hypothetical protein
LLDTRILRYTDIELSQLSIPPPTFSPPARPPYSAIPTPAIRISANALLLLIQLEAVERNSNSKTSLTQLAKL